MTWTYADPDHRTVIRRWDGGSESCLVIAPQVQSWIAEGNSPAPFQGPGLDVIKNELRARIDADAEAVRAKYLTPGAGMALTYSEKFAQAQGVHLLGAQAANALTEAERQSQFPTLSASVGIETATLYDCAVLVLTKYAQFAQISMVIERTRLAAKKAIDAAPSIEAAASVYRDVRWPA